jgi:predicted dehydrogenase
MELTTTNHAVGVVGYGVSAKIFHIPFILTTPGLTLAAVVQRSPTPADDAFKDHPGIKRYSSVEDLAADSTIDVMVITSTPEVHYEHAKLALLSNKAVIVEKPFCATSAQAQELADLAQSRGLLLSVYQNRRYDTDFVLVDKLLRDKTLGRVVELESHIDYYMSGVLDDWRGKHIPGGGAIYDLGSHLLDQAVCLFGMPQRVTGFVGTQRTKEENPDAFDDAFTVLLHYDDKHFLTATLKSNVVSPEARYLRFWVRGDKGTFLKYEMDVQLEQILEQGMRPNDPQYAAEPKENSGVLSQVHEDGSINSRVVPTPHEVNWRTYYSLFKKALDGHGSVPVSADIPTQVLRLIELAKESSVTGRTLQVGGEA